MTIAGTGGTAIGSQTATGDGSNVATRLSRSAARRRPVDMDTRSRLGSFVAAVTALTGLFFLVFGFWGLVAPDSFARATGFAEHHHFVHDLGAFQLGIGVSLLLALIWADALATVLTAVLAGNTAHVVNHFTDLEHGGASWQAWALAALSVGLLAALVVRLRELGYVVGPVEHATSAALAPFVRQKTVNLTTFRRDGTPGRSPVSIAVDGDVAYLRSFEAAAKTKRVRRNPAVEVAPATGRGKATGGPVISGSLRRLGGEEERHAVRLLRRKHPVLHGLVVPLTHRLGRRKFGRTVHFELSHVVVSDETRSNDAEHRLQNR